LFMADRLERGKKAVKKEKKQSVTRKVGKRIPVKACPWRTGK